MRRWTRSTLLLVALALVVGLAGPVGAHTETDQVAVPAGSEATVTLRPTHGCGGSPTVAVSTRVEVEGATGGEVPGWTVSSSTDAEGRTTIEWRGGSLPDDEVGAFPVTLTVPDAVGELLTFPFVQECENGEELAWIDGDPAAERPAPRVLVLAAGSAPAATIDDVPADAPGRDLLAAVVAVDTAADATTTTTGGPATTEPAPEVEEEEQLAPETTVAAADTGTEDDESSSVLPILFVVVAIGAAIAAAVVARRRRT